MVFDKRLVLVSLIIFLNLISSALASSIDIKLSTGWNMVSLPFSAYSVLSNNCNFTSKIWQYNPSTNSYVELSDFTKGSNGTAFWIKVDKDCVITFSGNRVSIDNFAKLNTGWNQVGSPSSPLFFSSIASECNVTSGPWKYDRKSNSYKYNDTLEPGIGYWVKVLSPCNLKIPFPVVHGKFVDVDWSSFQSNSSVAEWAVSTADSQYQFLARIQGIPLNRMRTRIPIKLGNGVGGGSGSSGITVNVDWFFGKNLFTPKPGSPLAGMSPADYSMVRLDAELYHEMAHYIPFGCPRAINNVCPTGVRCDPSWFIEGLGTWAQSAVMAPGVYTNSAAQLEDSIYGGDGYSSPDPFGAYSKTTAFFWYLIDTYGIEGFHKMIRLSFGMENGWEDGVDIDVKGFVPWTGKTGLQLSQEFLSRLNSGWRADIPGIIKRATQINQTNITCESNVYPLCTYVTPNNIQGTFTLNGKQKGDGERAVVTIGTPYILTAKPPSGYSFYTWTTARSVFVANPSSPSTTVTFGSSGWDGTCIGNLGVTYK